MSSAMSPSVIFEYIKKQGQVRDSEIATALKLSAGKVREALDELTASGQVFCCDLTRYENGKPIQEILCRISGYIPPAAPGRKPKG